MIFENVSKKYCLKNERIVILDSTSYKFEKGKFYAIVGHSGIGKSTLLNIIGLLDSYDFGSYFIDDRDTKNIKEKDKAYLRLHKFGFVFQEFYLSPKLNVMENVMIPMFINKQISKKEYKIRALYLLDKFNILDRSNHYPSELSGGEQQRVSLARALANDPSVILADEPTGNLDKDNEKIIFDELKELVKEGKTVIVVSHNDIIKKYADVVLTLREGKIVEE